jgi:bifunctional non-homologous end joining protein LigD
VATRKPSLPAGALPAPLPATLEPQLASLVSRAPAGDWLYEIKFDGYRMLARVDGPKDVRLFTRRGNDWTTRFPTLHAELLAARLAPGWYDGEFVLPGPDGRPSFNRLQNAIEGGDNAAIVYYLFDVPYLAGHDLRALPVEQRRALLRTQLRETHHLRFSEEIDGDGDHLLASACELGLEGVIGKRRGSRYVHGRSGDWVKLKCVQRQQFVIGGYTWPDASRTDPGLGALLVGTLDARGALQYAGKVGTGFTGEGSAQLRRRLDAIATDKRPFAGTTGHDRHAQWVRPVLVCEVAYGEWPEGGSLRHASFKGLRADKPAPEVRREAVLQAALLAPAGKAITSAAPPARPQRTARKATAATSDRTDADFVLDASTGITRAELIDYYRRVARWALPHLRGRPLYVRRAPGGLAGPTVFQQHPHDTPGLRGTDPALWPGHEPAIAIDTAEDLVLAARADVVELHAWNASAADIGHPDRVIFDLDPGDGVPWSQVQEAATLTRVMLVELGLESWLKTTGGKGLHVVVPLTPEFDVRTVKELSRQVVAHMAKTIPQRFTARPGPANRVGRIFIDYLRNGPAQSTATAYSARARPGMGVSVPVAWDELPDLHGGAQWDVRSTLDRLKGRRADPWAAFWKKKQSLRSALAAFGLGLV